MSGQGEVGVEEAEDEAPEDEHPQNVDDIPPPGVELQFLPDIKYECKSPKVYKNNFKIFMSTFVFLLVLDHTADVQ